MASADVELKLLPGVFPARSSHTEGGAAVWQAAVHQSLLTKGGSDVEAKAASGHDRRPENQKYLQLLLHR